MESQTSLSTNVSSRSKNKWSKIARLLVLEGKTDTDAKREARNAIKSSITKK